MKTKKVNLVLGYFRVVGRFVFAVTYTTLIVFEIYIKGKINRSFDIKKAMPIRQRWANSLLNGIGVKVSTIGIPPDFPCILVCNHRSYLDPIVLLREVNGCPVSKAEVEKWPILGYGAKLSGILYLQREDNGSRVKTLKAIAGAVQNGFPVIIFPEGTTSGGAGTIDFKKGAFQIAAKFKFPIVPVAFHYPDKEDFWIGNDTFFSHALRRFTLPAINVTVIYGAPIVSNDTDTLLSESRLWINQQLSIMQGENPFSTQNH